MSDEVLGPGAFGHAFRAFLDASLALAPTEEPVLVRRLREHLGVADPSVLPVVRRELASRDHPNLQLALDHLGWPMEAIGLTASMGRGDITLADLASPRRGMYGPSREPGPVEWVSFALGPEGTLAAMANVLLLLRDGEAPLAALVTRGERRMGESGLTVEVMAAERERGEHLLAELTRLMREHNVYRGRVLAFSRDEMGTVGVEIRTLPSVPREAIVLPAGVLERVERHALAPVRHRERLLAAGRHLKRGLLLHGPPGTGKTLTAMHLVGRLPGRTTVILTGESLGLIEPAAGLARELAPATLVLEDVDLVGHQRAYDGSTPILFELLNEMDGLAEDADVLFLLTTNRPDVLEPALAARPGRIDQAVELPLPDVDGRRRLVERYAEGLTLRVAGPALDAILSDLEGASAAHVKELLRKAALLAAEEREGDIVVEERHLRDGLGDLVISAGDMRDTLFAPGDPDDAFPFPPDD